MTSIMQDREIAELRAAIEVARRDEADAAVRAKVAEAALQSVASFLERSKFRLHYRESPPMFICVCEAASDDSSECTCPHPAFQQGCRPDCEACALATEKNALLDTLRSLLPRPDAEVQP
jgi:hypothetical protein